MIDTNSTAVGDEVAPRKVDHRSAPLWKPLLAFTLFAFAISLAGNFVFQRHRENIKRDIQNVLGGIAELKTGQITNWMQERKGDAQVFMDDVVFVETVDQWLRQGSPNGNVRKRLTERLTSLQRANEVFGYTSASLFDDKAMLRLSSSTREAPLHESERQHMLSTMRSGVVGFSEIHRRDSTERFEIELCAPLTLVREGKVRTVGALLFRIDPYRFMFPLIEHWPTPSASAENVLVRRDGNDVIFLNELRHGSSTDDLPRLPLSRGDLPAAMAALGKEGMVEGVDYRGVPVVGVLSRVPDTSWKIVSKIDRAEIYAPINSLARWVMLLMLVLICAGGGVALFWRAEERRQYESDLKQRRLTERLDYLSKHANDIIVLADDKGRIADFNDRALEAYGYSAKDFRGLSLYELRRPHYAPKFAEDFRHVQEKGSMRFESVHMRRNGEEFPVEISARAVDVDGKTFQQAIIRDISERKKAEEALLREKRFVRQIIDSDPNFIFVKDTEGRFLLANEAMARSFGLTTESIIGKYNWELTPNAEHVAEYDKTSKLALEHENQEWSGLQRSTLADGKEHVFHTIRRTLQQSDGSTSLLTVAMDITELKEAEAQLESERTRLRTLVQTIPDLVWLKDTAGVYLGCNPQFERYFGAKEGSIVGRTDRDLVDAPLADFRQQKDLETIAAGKACIDEEWITYPDNGERALLEVIRMPMRDDSGRLVGVMGIARNITERKRTEELIRGNNALLEIVFSSIHVMIAYLDRDFNFIKVNKAYAVSAQHPPEFFPGKNHFDLYPNEENEAIFRKAVETGEPVIYYAKAFEYAEHPERGVTYWDWRLEPVKGAAGRVEGLVFSLLNVTERKRAEEELRFKNTLLTTEHEVSIDGILVVDDQGNILSHNRRFLEIWNPHEEFTASGCDKHALQSIRDMLAEPEKFIRKLQHLQEHRDDTSRDEIVLRDGRVLEHYTAPMSGPNQEYYGRVWYFRDITELKLSAVNLARSYAQLQRLSLRMENAKAEERARIALNLHDEMGATLAAMKMRISWLASKLPADTPHLREEAAQISALVSDGIQTMRHIVTQLKPSLLGDVGLAAAIKDYVKKFQQHTNIECLLTLPEGEFLMDMDQSMTLLRILQECLNNVVKHAQASCVKIIFTEKEESLSMVIKDNGVGFETSAHREQSFGLLGIRERALMVGGKARISSTPGKGTSVSVSIPYPALRPTGGEPWRERDQPARQPQHISGVEP